MNIETLKDKEGKVLDSKLVRTLLKQSLSMKEGKELQKWYKRETGIIDEDSCMCHPLDRLDIKNAILAYLTDLNSK